MQIKVFAFFVCLLFSFLLILFHWALASKVNRELIGWLNLRFTILQAVLSWVHISFSFLKMWIFLQPITFSLCDSLFWNLWLPLTVLQSIEAEEENMVLWCYTQNVKMHFQINILIKNYNFLHPRLLGELLFNICSTIILNKCIIIIILWIIRKCYHKISEQTKYFLPC